MKGGWVTNNDSGGDYDTTADINNKDNKNMNFI